MKKSFNKVNGLRIDIGSDCKRINTPEASIAITAAQEALEIGGVMKDGTVVIAVDLKKNLALFAPEGIFGGESDFVHQDVAEKNANQRGLHGHKDWRLVTDVEAGALAKAWDKVAPPALHGSAAPWFWGASGNRFFGRVYRGDKAGRGDYSDRSISRPVPVVRSGPVRI